MKTSCRYSLIALLLASSFLPAGLFACGDDDDDDNAAATTPLDDDDDDNDDNDDNDNDDDAAPPPLPPLDLVIVDPIYWLNMDETAMAAELDAMAANGVGGVLWRWTYRMGKTTYPSAAFAPFVSMTLADPLAVLLDLAKARGLTVYLGLSAGRRVGDYYEDPIAPEYARNETLLDELAARYGDQANLAGFYIPYEFIPEPDENKEVLLTLIAGKVHALRADWQVLLAVKYPGFPQYRVPQYVLTNHLSWKFWLDEIDDGAYRSTWAHDNAAVLAAAGIDIALVATRLGSRRNDMAHAIMDFEALKRARDEIGGSTTLWSQLDLYDALGADEGLPPAHGPMAWEGIGSQAVIEAEGRVGFGWDYWRNENGELHGMSATAEPELAAKADVVLEHLLGKTLRDGQLVAVINGQHPLRLFGNVWQEDACWLTGLFLAAESYRYAVTGDPDALASAKAAWRAVLKMADVTPKRGEVVRNWTRYLYGQTEPVDPGADTIKRWTKHPTQEVYWVGDVSVDQLSGYFYGLATFYDLAAGAVERAEVASITDEIVDYFLGNNLWATQYDGQRCTYGNLRSAPELVSAFLLIAHHITGHERYLEAYNGITYDEYTDIKGILFHWAMHYVVRKIGGQHFQDSGYAHQFRYLTDPVAYRRWIWALEYVYLGSFLIGNTYANFTHQMQVPDSAGAARGLAELYDYDPELLDNGVWFRKINRTWPDDAWVGMDERPAKEFEWCWGRYGETEPRGSSTYRYTGIGYLLTYWQGRYFGWIR